MERSDDESSLPAVPSQDWPPPSPPETPPAPATAAPARLFEPFPIREKAPSRWRKVLSVGITVAVVAAVLFLTHGKIVSRKPPRNRAAATTTTAAPPLDREGHTISVQSLDDFERSCRTLGLNGVDTFCHCSRIHLPGHVLAADIERATTFLAHRGSEIPPDVKAVMDGCAASTPLTATTRST